MVDKLEEFWSISPYFRLLTESEKGIYILSSHAGPMQDARRLKPKRPKPANCKQEN